MFNPKVTIIIPVYNADKYIASCLNSVLSQSYDNWEAIIVNDCATDNSHVVIMEYVTRYPQKFRYVINNTNVGQGESRNIALSRVLGDWIFFLDADDTIESNALDVFMSIVNEKSYDIILGNNYILKGKHQLSTNNDIVSNFNFSRYSLGLYAWGTLFNYNFWRRNKFKFTNFAYAEDLILMSKVWSSTELICVVNSKLYNYRLTENSATHKFYGFQEIYPVLEALLKFCCVEHESDEMVAFALSNSYNFIKMVASPLARYRLFKLVRCYIKTYPVNNDYATAPLITSKKSNKLKYIYLTNGLYFFIRLDTRLFKNIYKKLNICIK